MLQQNATWIVKTNTSFEAKLEIREQICFVIILLCLLSKIWISVLSCVFAPQFMLILTWESWWKLHLVEMNGEFIGKNRINFFSL